jgi:hypothetical protein
MASVSQKLKSFRESQEKDNAKDEITKIKAMSLEELAMEKIAFGRAKLGQSFETVFQDHQWTDWFVSTYEKSPKPAHQLFVHYVEKRLNQEALKNHKKGYPSTKGNSKKSTETMAAEVNSWDEISEPDFSQEFEIPGVSKINQMEDQVASLQMQNQNMTNRMTQVEMVLQEVLQHVRGLSVKTEPQE